MRHILVTAFVFVSSAIAATPAQGQAPPAAPVITRVFGPETPTGPYKHPASLTELSNGDLYLVYYGGQGEYARDTAVFGARLEKGKTTWSRPVPIARDPFRSVGNGVIWQAPDGVVWLFYVVRFGETWGTSRIQAKVSRDLAATWSDAFPVALEAGMMVRNRPIVLHDGSYLLPVYLEDGADTENVGPKSTSRFLRFDPKAQVWEALGEVRSARGNIQPGVVEVAPNHLIAYARRGGGYGPVTDGWLVRSESRDGGRTWTEGTDSAFPNPNSAVDFVKLSSGALLLAYNDHMWKRTPLMLALSDDQDRTWPVRKPIATGENSYAYPVALQARDGRIHIVYTSDARKVINHAVLTEAWVRAR
jgi:predicted neuraminidase